MPGLLDNEVCVAQVSRIKNKNKIKNNGSILFSRSENDKWKNILTSGGHTVSPSKTNLISSLYKGSFYGKYN